MVFISSFYCASSGGETGTWNCMGCVDELSCLVLGRGGRMWCMRGRCTLALMPSWSKNAWAMLWVSWVWMLMYCVW